MCSAERTMSVSPLPVLKARCKCKFLQTASSKLFSVLITSRLWNSNWLLENKETHHSMIVKLFEQMEIGRNHDDIICDNETRKIN